MMKRFKDSSLITSLLLVSNTAVSVPGVQTVLLACISQSSTTRRVTSIMLKILPREEWTLMFNNSHLRPSHHSLPEIELPIRVLSRISHQP
jgi:hypothetical protein